MGWPSGTKAGTTNVDAGTDLIANARPDIKQNIDNVNEIIDHLNISSPSDGDLLQYSSSSGKWEQVASSSIGASVSIVPLASPGGSFSIGDNLINLSDSTDNGDVDLNAVNNTWTFTSTGTYFVKFLGAADTATGNVSFKIRNDTQSTYVFTQTITNNSGLVTSFNPSVAKITVSSTSDVYKMVVNSTSASGSLSNITGCRLEFIRV